LQKDLVFFLKKKILRVFSRFLYQAPKSLKTIGAFFFPTERKLVAGSQQTCQILQKHLFFCFFYFSGFVKYFLYKSPKSLIAN